MSLRNDKMKIKEAAINVDGELFTGKNHSSILLGNLEIEGITRGEKGFITECDRFVTRRAAAHIALRSGQVEKLQHPSHGLFSDELVKEGQDG